MLLFCCENIFCNRHDDVNAVIMVVPLVEIIDLFVVIPVVIIATVGFLLLPLASLTLL